MNIVYVASEENPFAKTGGLADVLGSLPQSAAEANGGGKTKVLTFLPKYAAVDTQRYPLRPVGGEISVPIGPRLEKGQVWTLTQPLETAPNVKSYFIENRKYFDRPTLYGYGSDDFKDNNERFTFFARGVLEFCKNIGFAPDILHCHDWQTGLIPAYLKIVYHSDPFFQRTRTIFTIHNIAYQGIFPAKTVALAGFPDSEFTPEKLEYYGQLSMLKAGILYADKVTTVSPTYAREVVENPNFGRGMDGLLRERQHDFVGILNGLDYGEWNPAQDSYLAGTFSPRSKNWSAQKKKCKADLQKQIG
ncbi:MAG: glycogen/starch synthase, partial [Elusimicrobia bacterium]|nr:glycogen/starch synthase [Elusimicrobiota bacterium]